MEKVEGIEPNIDAIMAVAKRLEGKHARNPIQRERVERLLAEGRKGTKYSVCSTASSNETGYYQHVTEVGWSGPGLTWGVPWSCDGLTIWVERYGNEKVPVPHHGITTAINKILAKM